MSEEQCEEIKIRIGGMCLALMEILEQEPMNIGATAMIYLLAYNGTFENKEQFLQHMSKGWDAVKNDHI